MNKKKINTIIFFTILYWLAVYILIFRKGLIFGKVTFVHILILLSLNLFIALIWKLLEPVFDLIIKLTGKLGSLIFLLISTIVFLFILTPISLFRRLSGKKMLNLGFEEGSDSYYEKWEKSSDFSKQY